MLTLSTTDIRNLDLHMKKRETTQVHLKFTKLVPEWIPIVIIILPDAMKKEKVCRRMIIKLLKI